MTAALAMDLHFLSPIRRPASRSNGWPLLLSVAAHALLLPLLLLHSDPPPEPPPALAVELVMLPPPQPVAEAATAPAAAPPQPAAPAPAAELRRPAKPSPSRRHSPRPAAVAAEPAPMAMQVAMPAAAVAAPAPAPAAFPAATAEAGTGGKAAAPPADYIAQIRARLEAAKVYPPEARRSGREGTVLLRFSLDRSGRLLDWAIAAGSGVAALDQAAGDMAVRAAPFPSFPADFTRSRLEMVVPVHFSLMSPHSGW